MAYHAVRPAPLVTNHGHVLLAIAANPNARLRDVAAKLDITERTVTGLLDDLETAGYITRRRVGRRNRYEVHGDARLEYPLESHHCVGDLVEAMVH